MKCYYEILNISRDADLAEIKSSYKKLALKWHPDKNLDDPEAAKEQFQLVQQAYEVLSDPQERAWYDKHREQILRGSNSEYEDNSLDVFQYFTTTCYKGYGDDENGFYTVYRKVFDKIIEEDMEFMENKEELENIPRFGNSKSDYDEVVGPFYNYWQSYSTKKTYVWLDPYSIKETRDRRVSKLIEKENKKVRQKAKKERNEEIRNLVAFVRKRDKRVQEHQKLLEERIQENRRKQQQISKQKRLERQKELDQNQGEWSQFHNLESELIEIEKNLAEEFGENSEEDLEYNELYCVACDKFFKTDKALKNHELSKKHKENVKLLKASMLEEDHESSEAENTENEIKIDENCIKSEKIHENDPKDDLDISKKKNKKTTKKNRVKDEINGETEADVDKEEHIKLGKQFENSSDDDFDFSLKKNKKNTKKNKVKVEIEKPTVVKENKTKKNEETEIKVDLNHCCVTCKAEFSSKNKLFNHLKTTGHGVYIPTKAKNKLKK